MIHEVKCLPVYFAQLADGTKTFEVRKDDRGYEQGDLLHICEWHPGSAYYGRYTGNELTFCIGFVFRSGCGIDLGDHVVLSLLPVESVQEAHDAAVADLAGVLDIEAGLADALNRAGLEDGDE